MFEFKFKYSPGCWLPNIKYLGPGIWILGPDYRIIIIIWNFVSHFKIQPLLLIEMVPSFVIYACLFDCCQQLENIPFCIGLPAEWKFIKAWKLYCFCLLFSSSFLLFILFAYLLTGIIWIRNELLVAGPNVYLHHVSGQFQWLFGKWRKWKNHAKLEFSNARFRSVKKFLYNIA